MRNRTVLVTGASAGIGAAVARVFAARGFDLILTARRRDRLDVLAVELRTAHGCAVQVIAADLADPAAPGRIEREVAAAGLQVDALVNNAGYGLPGRFLASDWEQHRAFIQVMVTAVAELCHRFAPGMVDRRRGWIINVASAAGLTPATAGHTLYGASKALVIRFTESLARELQPHGVHVTALCPGFTYSEFHDVNRMREQVSRLPRWMWMDADTVARQAFDAVMLGDIVYVNGRANRVMIQAARFAPAALVDLVMKRVAPRFRRT
ncbi:MAG TPA: SDR family oxidoreductase [Vicinamibacterales bacterium]|nr:SDR family oxidoreductase [Vicinamibacterales bacterium]